MDPCGFRIARPAAWAISMRLCWDQETPPYPPQAHPRPQSDNERWSASLSPGCGGRLQSTLFVRNSVVSHAHDGHRSRSDSDRCAVERVWLAQDSAPNAAMKGENFCSCRARALHRLLKSKEMCHPSRPHEVRLDQRDRTSADSHVKFHPS